mmetsp:Transcript_16383/g.16545  ORF Transcript_16383/g.16545 Transcript_16383/m.16545 type:complete len:264 (-) Transcript_16383:52-843(-)
MLLPVCNDGSFVNKSEKKTGSNIREHPNRTTGIKQITILLIPPTPMNHTSCSKMAVFTKRGRKVNDGFSLMAERMFTTRLIQLQNNTIRHKSIDAYLSTMGGGYHTIRRLSTAIRLARLQRTNALKLENVHLADCCTVNECYNYIYAGFVEDAVRALTMIQARAEERRDAKLVRLCETAAVFGTRVQAFHQHEISKHDGNIGRNDEPLLLDHDAQLKVGRRTDRTRNATPSCYPMLRSKEYDETTDNFQRIRIVDTSKLSLLL